MQTIQLRRSSNGTTHSAYLEGELDAVSAPQVRAQLFDCIEHADIVYLDVSELWFCDSTGLRLLFELATSARESGKRFSLCRPNPTLRTLLDLIDAAKIVHIAA